jgi:hypothetical protein
MKKIIFISLCVLCVMSCKKNIETNGALGLGNNPNTKVYYEGDKNLLKIYRDFYEKLNSADLKTGYMAANLSSPSVESKRYSESEPVWNGGFFTNTFGNLYFSNDMDKTLVPLHKKTNKFLVQDIPIEGIFGRKIKFSLEDGKDVSNRNSNWSDSLYVPRLLNVRRSPDRESFSKSSGLTLTWDVDNNREHDKGVLITVNYHHQAEKLENGSLPNQDIDKNFIVLDNGTFTLNTANLGEFPTPLNHLSVSVFRGNFRLSDFNTQTLPLLIYNKSGYSLKMSN